MNKKAKQRPLDKLKSTEKLNKGVAKLIHNEFVFPDRAPRKERKVVVDHKTWLYVKEDDKRTDEEIRKDFLRRIS